MIRLFIILLLLASPVLAEELDSRWVYYGDTFERNDLIFAVENGGFDNRLLLYVNDDPYILEIGQCKENSQEKEKYCIEESAYQDDSHDDKIRYEGGEELFGYELVTYSIIPELKVTRSISPNPAYDEKSTITVTLENEGEKVIESIRYSEEMPESLEVSLIDTKRTDNTISHEILSLAPGKTKLFQYAITPKEYLSTSIKPEVSYAYESLRKEASVSGISISLSEPVAITRTTQSVEVEQEGIYTLTIENKGQGDLQLQTEIMPGDLEITQLGSFKWNNEKLVIEEELEKDEEKEFTFSYKASRTGNYPLQTKIKAQVDDQEMTKQYTDTVTASVKKLKPELLFSRIDNWILEGETATITASLENEGGLTFVNIKGEVKASFLDRTVTYQKVVSEEEKQERYTITGPAVDKKTNEKITFIGSYETRNGEQFTFSAEQTISIEPSDEPFLIEQEANSTNPEVGDTIRMRVSITNNNRPLTELFIQDDLPYQPVGRTDNTLSFERGQEREVYIYEFTVENENPFNITTTISTEGFEEEKTLQFTPVTPEAEEEQETPEEEPQIQEEESEEGFFTKVWNWLKGFFTED